MNLKLRLKSLAAKWHSKQPTKYLAKQLTNPLNTQIGGEHYKQAVIQPVVFIDANKLGFLEGCVIKRLQRHDKPTGKGAQDIDKAIHELQLIKQLRYS